MTSRNKFNPWLENQATLEKSAVIAKKITIQVQREETHGKMIFKHGIRTSKTRIRSKLKPLLKSNSKKLVLPQYLPSCKLLSVGTKFVKKWAKFS